MKHIVRRAAAGGILIAALVSVAAGCRIYSLMRPRAMPAEAVQASQEAQDPLLRFRTERQQLRQKQRAELNDIIHNPSTDAATLDMAQRQLMALMQSEAAETTLEGLLSARGFKDVLVSANGQTVNVLTRGEPLNQRQTAVILDLIIRETGITAGNTKILAIN